MKYCFLVNNAPFLSEFFGKLFETIIRNGNECILVVNNKISEFEKIKYFPKEAKVISVINWCAENYKDDKREFGNLSWREFFSTFDRSHLDNIDYDRAISLIGQNYQFFEFLFREEKPDVIVGEPPVGLFIEMAYYFANKNNKPYLGFIDSRFDKRIDIYDLKTGCSKFKKTFDALNVGDIKSEEKEFANDFVADFISHKQLPSGTSAVTALFTHTNQAVLVGHFLKRMRESGKPLLKYFISRSKYKKFDYEGETIFKSSMAAFVTAEKRKIRTFSQKRFFKKPKDESYFIFPLHFQPEYSTSIQATYYVNQLNTIKNIAFSLPLPYKLYVKEHPIAVGTRRSNFYKELEKIPNVVLIFPYANVKELIKKSAGVITLTSTIGLEAAISGKQVYVLGDVFYTYHPFCYKVVNFDDLRNKLQENIFKKNDIVDLKEINERFIISYFRNTIKGAIMDSNPLNDLNDYGKIYQEIKRLFLR